MHFNNLKLVNHAFDLIKEEEAKINYYYEPLFLKRNKKWKRHLNFNDLKEDFMNDITNLGFCPYIEKSCAEQMKNKKIMKFSKNKNTNCFNFLKRFHCLLNPNPNKNLNNISVKIENNKNLGKTIKIPKLKRYSNKSLLFSEHKKRNESKKRRDSNISIKNEHYSLNNKNEVKKITNIVKFSRENNIDKTMKQKHIISKDNNISFSFGSNDEKSIDFFLYYAKNYDDKEEIYNKNKNHINEYWGALINDIKINTFNHSNIPDNSNNKKANKTLVDKNNQIRNNKKKYILNSTKMNSLNSTLISYQKNKKRNNTLLINKNDPFKNKKNKNKRNRSVEGLENFTEGIFKLAVKYNNSSKKY